MPPLLPIHSPLMRASALGLSLFTLSACDTPPTQVDQSFGLAVKQAQMQQTLNPPHTHCPMGSAMSPCPGAAHGSAHPHGREGHRASTDSDGESVHSAILRYQESFASPTSPAPGAFSGTGTVIKR
jgi:hypothetical protein